MSPGIQEWFAARLPAPWDARGLEIHSDQDEILVIVDLDADAWRGSGSGSATGEARPEGSPDSPDPQDLTAVRRFRESTRDERVELAEAAEQAFGRKVSWGARTGEVAVIFTTASLPVMTRLRLPERRILDTLIDAGVARSRSEALSWCVRLVGDNEKEWIGELRSAFEAVEAARDRGPRTRRKPAP
jgi:hypothetical protein